MQTFSTEVRCALFTHLDAAVFADAGKVASRVEDLDLRHLRRSYGAGLRVHNSTATLVRLDVGHSVEGWQVFLKISDLSRPSQSQQGVPLRRSADDECIVVTEARPVGWIQLVRGLAARRSDDTQRSQPPSRND
jgi:hypothetical protein